MASEVEIIRILKTLAGIYGIEPPSVQGFVWALEDIRADALDPAAREICKKLIWYPKPAELRETAMRIQADLNARDERTILWEQSQALLNASLRGEITEEQLYADKAWQWFLRQRKPVTEAEQLRLDAAWELAQRQTEAWLAADFGPNWRTEWVSEAVAIGNWPVEHGH